MGRNEYSFRDDNRSLSVEQTTILLSLTSITTLQVLVQHMAQLLYLKPPTPTTGMG